MTAGRRDRLDASPSSPEQDWEFLPGADDDAPEPVGRVEALDGIRALAVLLVLLFHVGVPGLTGGFLGVDAFFVLSGFLITTLLLRDIVARGRVDLARFWARRMARLLPAVLLLFVVVALWALLVAPSFRRTPIGEDLLWSLLYVGNWRFIGTSSYFAADGTTSPLLHLWSLSVEEQFYVVWPLLLQLVAVLLASASRGRHARRDLRGALRRSTNAVVVTGAVVAVLSMAACAHWYLVSGPDRPYMGTDTKVFEPLLGGIFAAGLLRPRVAAWVGRHAQALMSVGVVGVLTAVATLGGGTEGPRPAYFLGGAVATSLAVVLLVAGGTKVPPDRGWGRVFGHPVATYLGRISYGLYLWHWPWAGWLLPPGRFDVPRVLLVLMLTLASAALSYRYVEKPLRGGRVRRLRPVRVLRAGAGSMAVVCVAPALLGATPWYGGTESSPGSPRLLLVGDSVPGRLTAAFAEAGTRHGVTVENATRGGCAAMGILTINEDGTVFNPPVARPPGSNDPVCAVVPSDQQEAVARYHPSVVLWWSRYEYADRLGPDGAPLRAHDPGFWPAQRASLDAAVDRLTAEGARLVIVEPEPSGRNIAATCTSGTDCPAFLRRLRDEDDVRQQWTAMLRAKAATDRRLRLIRVSDVFCRTQANPCDDRLPLATGDGFPPAVDAVARTDGAHFVPTVAGPVAEAVLSRAMTAVA